MTESALRRRQVLQAGLEAAAAAALQEVKYPGALVLETANPHGV